VKGAEVSRAKHLGRRETVGLMTRMDPETHRKLSVHCAERGLFIGRVVERAVEEYLERAKP
jgi:predicted HicB family RNase H-like nuclease